VTGPADSSRLKITFTIEKHEHIQENIPPSDFKLLCIEARLGQARTKRHACRRVSYSSQKRPQEWLPPAGSVF
ncbi:MAG: hypothetical protein OEU92_32235, partial [Alphaproteobacteria bacterium]|nr:hypothetical protein [Alphaproteobacteria bacterium]